MEWRGLTIDMTGYVTFPVEALNTLQFQNNISDGGPSVYRVIRNGPSVYRVIQNGPSVYRVIQNGPSVYRVIQNGPFVYRVTTSPPSRAECREIWEPKSPETLCATTDLLRECFTFFMCLLYT